MIAEKVADFIVRGDGESEGESREGDEGHNEL